MHFFNGVVLILSLLPVFSSNPQQHPDSSATTRYLGTIVFERLGRSLLDGDIYSINADGTDLKQLTQDGHSHDPSWSSDGKHILFVHVAASTVSNRQGRFELCVMNRDGSGAHCIKHLENNIFSAAWSPDGKTIAVTYTPKEWAGLARLNPPEPAPAGLFLLPADGAGEPRLLFRNGWTPSWSPDGTRIAFTMQLQRSRSWTVHVADSDGSNDKQLTEPSRDAGSPSWSADGKHIAFSAVVGESGREQVFIMDDTGLHARQLTRDPNWDCQHPSWSPDGKQIAVWCMSAFPACSPGSGSGRSPAMPCLRHIFVISTTEPQPQLRQLTDETGVSPEFAPTR